LDYDVDRQPDLTPYIAAANAVVNQVVSLSSKRPLAGNFFGTTLDSTTAELVERWLAAHYYQAQDKGFESKSTGVSSGSFQGQKGSTGLETTEYGKRALLLDWTGCLEALDKRKFAGGQWLGKPPSVQIPYSQRR
jgi:hypothetical protein